MWKQLPLNMAKPFVKINNGELCLMTDITFENAKVVSILGKARMGKSSFLNTLSAYMTKENKKIFATKGTFEHVTKGVDYYHIPEQNILLLDTQGLDHEDSSHDPILLLFVYLISDVIIFNGTNQLQNDTLKLLEPICAFMHSVDLDEISKPKLFFRIANAFPIVLENPSKSLDTINMCYDDQYQSIRDSIRLLFQDDIDVVATDHLNKSATAFIDAGTFKPLLEDVENGFLPAIQKIVDALLKPSDKKNKYLHKIPEVIKQINNNEKINISKLDVVALTAENDILQWLQTWDSTAYAPIQVDGLQKTYMDLVESRKMKKKYILSSFTRKFNSVSDKIKNKHYNELNTKLSDPILKAIEESLQKAEARVEHAFSRIQNASLPKISSTSTSFTNIPETFMFQYLKVYHDLQEACEDIYEPVKEKYLKICMAAYDSFNKVLNEQEEKENEYLERMREICKDIIAIFIENETQSAKRRSDYKILLHTNEELVADSVKKVVQSTEDVIQKLTTYSEIQGIVKGNSLSFTVTELISCLSVTSYDLTQNMWESFTNKINELSKELIPVWTEIKKKMLEGKHFDSKSFQMMHVILRNPEIRFMSNNIVEDYLSTHNDFMTVETYEKIYNPLIQEAIEAMVIKGYCRPKYAISYDMVRSFADNAVFWNYTTNDKYDKNFKQILYAKLAKLYCKKIVQGMEFTKILDASELV